MIRKQDILDRAVEWRLRPDVVEKDYVLGWLLAGLSRMAFGESWVFKGGTCIKKCYVETYRFSEDLDFSLVPGADYTGDAVTGQLRALTASVAELSGLEFPPDAVEVRQRRNQQGQPTFEGRVAYRGPLGFPGQPKVRFDLTQHETVLDGPEARPVFHPYPDELPEGTAVNAYSFNELLAEKARALLERSRPRDLYDVVHLLENAPGEFDLDAARALFLQKCMAKAIGVPSCARFVAIVRADAELRSEWENMLAHQLPALPDLDGFLVKLPTLLAWVDAPSERPIQVRLPIVAAGSTEASVFAPGIRYWGSGSPLEAIRFAATNRLLLEFDYHGKHREVEPYSVRQAQTGNVLLYAWELASSQIKAFKTHEMSNVRSAGSTFAPRYQVEISAFGPVGTQAVLRRRMADSSRPRRSPSSTWSRGPKYVFECSFCNKRFDHSTNDSSLRPHKDKRGWDCPGRHGYFVDTRY